MEKKINVMVVEDENLLLQAISKKLKLNNVSPISCSSGKQAFDYLQNLEKLPDVIWLDYYLNDMNGLDFMTKLKEKPQWAKIPVAIVSNSASPQKVHNLLAIGAKKYLLKAKYRLEDLIKIVIDVANEGIKKGEQNG